MDLTLDSEEEGRTKAGSKSSQKAHEEPSSKKDRKHHTYVSWRTTLRRAVTAHQNGFLPFCAIHSFYFGAILTTSIGSSRIAKEEFTQSI